MRVIKKDALITGVDFSIPYYEKLGELAQFLANNQNEDAKQHLETVLILIHTLEVKAEEQGLISDVVPT